jgi:hypothetical protein
MNTQRQPCVFSPVLSVAGATVLLLTVLFSPDGLPALCVCWFRSITGLPCPACGLTHAMCAISHGSFGDAWAYNPFGYVFYGLALLALFGPVLSRYWPSFEMRLAQGKTLSRLTLVLLGSLLTFGVARLWSM